MLGIYILAAIVGGGLLLFSVLSGAIHDVAGVDSSVLHGDVSGANGDVSGFDAHAGGADVHGGGVHGDHDVQVGHAGELVLGLFRPRNLTFFLTAFGCTGTLLTWTGSSPGATLASALVMGGAALLVTHGVFVWLRRSESVVDAMSEQELEGVAGRVVLPLQAGAPGRIACVIADQEYYLTARLAPDVGERLEAGREVIILSVENGVAEVIPFDAGQLPPGESRG